MIKGCWNQIGVRGDSSCPELVKYVHCRNCPVYAEAAVEVLDREPPEGYLQELTDRLGCDVHSEDMVGGEGLKSSSTEVLVFRLGREWLALPTILFEQAAHMRPMHPLPNRRTGAVTGLANVRGELLICISLEKVLGLQEGPRVHEKGARRRDRLLVINAAGARLAFAVDEVDSIYKYNPLELSPVPSTLAKASVRHTSGALVLGGKNVGRLDEERLMGAVYASFV